MNYKLYVGLNVDGERDISIGDGINTIVSVAKNMHIEALSIGNCQGIYTYDNGKTVFENTLVITLVNYEKDINDLIRAIKKDLRQESVMIEIINNSFIFR